MVCAREVMTIPIYSTLMKVYAFSARYDKACDIYPEILADGLEPDACLYGCLMKSAVECGRNDLSRTLGDKMPSLDIQAHMSLIRAAGRVKGVNAAFAVIRFLQASGVSLDIAAYNCVLDVCVSAGVTRRAFPLGRDAVRGLARGRLIQRVTGGLLRDTWP